MQINNLTRPPENCPTLYLSFGYDESLGTLIFCDHITVLKSDSNGACLAAFEGSPEKVSDLFNLEKMTNEEKENLSNIVGCEKDDLEDMTIKELSYHDVLALLSTFESDFDGFITRGYSQGDSCIVIFKKENRPDKKFIDHLFWDCPVYACLTVDGEYHDLTEFLEDHYNYSKKEILENCKGKFSAYVYKWLSEILPEEVPYL